jgi:hypothetical protein
MSELVNHCTVSTLLSCRTERKIYLGWFKTKTHANHKNIGNLSEAMDLLLENHKVHKIQDTQHGCDAKDLQNLAKNGGFQLPYEDCVSISIGRKEIVTITRAVVGTCKSADSAFEKASLEWCRGNSKVWENPVRENTTHYTVGYTCKVVL